MKPENIDPTALGESIIMARRIVILLNEAELVMCRNSLPIRMTYNPGVAAQVEVEYGPEFEAVRERSATARNHLQSAMVALCRTDDPARNLQRALLELKAVMDVIPMLGTIFTPKAKA